MLVAVLLLLLNYYYSSSVDRHNCSCQDYYSPLLVIVFLLFAIDMNLLVVATWYCYNYIDAGHHSYY